MDQARLTEARCRSSYFSLHSTLHGIGSQPRFQLSVSPTCPNPIQVQSLIDGFSGSALESAGLRRMRSTNRGDKELLSRIENRMKYDREYMKQKMNSMTGILAPYGTFNRSFPWGDVSSQHVLDAFPFLQNEVSFFLCNVRSVCPSSLNPPTTTTTTTIYLPTLFSLHLSSSSFIRMY